MSQEKYPVVVGQSTVLALSRVDTYYTPTELLLQTNISSHLKLTRLWQAK